MTLGTGESYLAWERGMDIYQFYARSGERHLSRRRIQKIVLFGGQMIQVSECYYTSFLCFSAHNIFFTSVALSSQEH